MKPVAAAVAGALISGVAMYTVGARTATVDAFTQPAPVQTEVGQYGPTTQLVSTAPAGRIVPVKNYRTFGSATHGLPRIAEDERTRIRRKTVGRDVRGRSRR
jgi:hypothetical protein